MSDETVPRLVTVWCAGLADGRRPHATRPAGGGVPRQPRRSPARRPPRAAGVGHGDRRRVAQAACPDLQVLERDDDRDGREFEPIVRADRRHGAARRSRRTGLAVRRRTWSVALLRRRPSAGGEGSCVGRRRCVRRADRGRHRRRAVGVGDRGPARQPPRRSRARWSPPARRRSSSSRWRSGGCASWARSTPSWSTCSPGSGLRTLGALAALDAG